MRPRVGKGAGGGLACCRGALLVNLQRTAGNGNGCVGSLTLACCMVPPTDSPHCWYGVHAFVPNHNAPPHPTHPPCSYAVSNTRRGIETCGILAGELSADDAVFTITTLIVPKQEGTTDTV